MKSANEALLAAGMIKAITRGRRSRANTEWLDAQVAKGTKFSDYPKGSVPVPAKPVVEKPKSDGTSKASQGKEKVIADYVVFYDINTMECVEPNGTTHSLAECCNNCRVSLVQCHCGAPSIYNNIPVTIRVKK